MPFTTLPSCSEPSGSEQCSEAGKTERASVSGQGLGKPRSAGLPDVVLGRNYAGREREAVLGQRRSQHVKRGAWSRRVVSNHEGQRVTDKTDRTSVGSFAHGAMAGGETSGGTRRDRSCLHAGISEDTPACRPCHSGGLLGLALDRGAVRLVLGCRSALLATRWSTAAILGRLLRRGVRPRSGHLSRIGDSAPERDAINRGRVVRGGCPLLHPPHCRHTQR